MDLRAMGCGGRFDRSLDTRLSVHPKDAWVEVAAQLRWTANSSGERLVRIIKNGSEMVATDRRAAEGRSEVMLRVGPLPVEAGDYFEMDVRQMSGHDLVLEASGTSFSLRPFWLGRGLQM